MEVTKLGTKNLATCGHCGSELRYVESDVQLQHGKPTTASPWDVEDFGPEDNFSMFLTCPVCRHTVPLRKDRALIARLLERRRHLD